MAQAISTDRELFTCPICLDLLRNPVTINCGHSYCMGCINDCWDREDQKGVYSCPQCRQTFTPRPVLKKNNIVAELAEQIRKTRIQAVPVHCPTGPEEVKCDLCTDGKLKAVKSCLDCLSSYCEAHFRVHNDVNPGGKHKVVDATGQQRGTMCSQHEKPLEIFCRTDQSCVCLLGLVDEHKGHDTVSASAGRREKQTHLGETQRRFQQRIQEREKELQELKKAVETLKSSAQTAVEDSERIFAEMIRSIEKRRSEVTQLIRAQEKAEVSQAEGLLKQLEQEIAELKRRDAEMEELSHTDDHIHFLKMFQFFSDTPESRGLPSICVNQGLSFEAMKKSVSSLTMQLEDFCNNEVLKLSAVVNEIQAVLVTEPTNREEFLKYSCHFTLDPNTANRYLHLSGMNRTVEWRYAVQSYPDHPERFDKYAQVLCREGVSGRCYWEVQLSGERWVNIAVSYKGISREGWGDECGFGFNDQSWVLGLWGSLSSFRHNNKETKLPLVTSSRIGVYVDHSAGILAFYSISDTMTLLHKVQTIFTDILYPGFGLGTRSSVKLLRLTL